LVQERGYLRRDESGLRRGNPSVRELFVQNLLEFY